MPNDSSYKTPPGLVTVTNPEVLKKYGWKAPYPSYVTAAPNLWKVWLEDAQRSRVTLSTHIDKDLVRELNSHTDPNTHH